MKDFITSLKIKDLGPLAFHFNGITCPDCKKYHVSVCSGEDVKYHFDMVQKSGHWKIVAAPLPPAWILHIERRLELEIYSGDRTSSQKDPMKPPNHLKIQSEPNKNFGITLVNP